MDYELILRRLQTGKNDFMPLLFGDLAGQIANCRARPLSATIFAMSIPPVEDAADVEKLSSPERSTVEEIPATLQQHFEVFGLSAQAAQSFLASLSLCRHTSIRAYPHPQSCHKHY